MLFSCSIIRYNVTLLQISSAKVLIYVLTFNSNDPFPSKCLGTSFLENRKPFYLLLLQIAVSITVQLHKCI